MRATLLALAVAALAACGPDIATRTASTVLSCDMDKHQQNVDWGDADLKGKIEFGDAVHGDAGGLVRVQVPIHNLSTDTLHVEYKFAFYDGQGMEMEGLSGAWQSKAANGRETVNMEGLAPKTGARSWRLYVRGDKPIRS